MVFHKNLERAFEWNNIRSEDKIKLVAQVLAFEWWKIQYSPDHPRLLRIKLIFKCERQKILNLKKCRPFSGKVYIPALSTLEGWSVNPLPSPYQQQHWLMSNQLCLLSVNQSTRFVLGPVLFYVYFFQWLRVLVSEIVNAMAEKRKKVVSTIAQKFDIISKIDVLSSWLY